MGHTTILHDQGGTIYRLVNRESYKAAVNNVVSLAPIHFSMLICALQNMLLVISVEIMDIMLGCAIRNQIKTLEEIFKQLRTTKNQNQRKEI